MRDGSYVGTREMAGVTTEELIRMMVGRALGELFPKQPVEPGEVVLEVGASAAKAASPAFPFSFDAERSWACPG